MCGIAGIWQLQARTSETSPSDISQQMAAQLHHRGPDSHGHWTDINHGISLAFRRLSILDLSPTGEQPMQSHEGRFVIVFNGEIYNYKELRQEVSSHAPGARYQGGSDTEVLLSCISAWGIAQTLPKLNGMFAMAIWDREKKELVLARDRLGKKPLYYGWFKGNLIFASELKAIYAYPSFEGKINRKALGHYFRLGYFPAPDTIYEGLLKLPAASYLTLSPSTQTSVATQFWDAGKTVTCGNKNHFRGTESEAIELTQQILNQSVKLRLHADVPVGCFLSGGIDSSLISAIAQRMHPERLKTFSLGFPISGYNETLSARKIAQSLGTDHTEAIIDPKEAMSVIPELSQIYDEPFSDSSQIPMLLIAKLARQQVTVCLSGDGADELFGGYNRYVWGPKLWNAMDLMPGAMRDLLSLLPVSQIAPILERSQGILPKHRRVNKFSNKLTKLFNLLASRGREEFHLRLVSRYPEPQDLLLDECAPTVLNDKMANELSSFSEQMMFFDMMSILSEDMMTKVDRATMHFSLEARCPFMDPAVVEWAWQLPIDFKLRENQGKWILRQVLYRYLPKELFRGPKMGFEIPLDDWLRTDLRDWAEVLLSPTSIERAGLLNSKTVSLRWQEHLSGHRNWRDLIWGILSLQAWIERQREHKLGAPFEPQVNCLHSSKTEPVGLYPN